MYDYRLYKDNIDKYMEKNLKLSQAWFRNRDYRLVGDSLTELPYHRYPIKLNNKEVEFAKRYGLKPFLVWRHMSDSEKEELEEEIKEELEEFIKSCKRRNEVPTVGRLFAEEVDIVENSCDDMESTIINRLDMAEKERKEKDRREQEEIERKREIERQKEEARREKFRYNQKNGHYLDSGISFRKSDHVYMVSGVCLESVTTFVSNCFPKFNTELHAKHKAETMGVAVQEIIEMWEQKGKESRDLGIAMHEKIENYYQGIDFIEDDTFKLFKIFANHVKLEPYRTEWAVYDWECKIAGTIDFVDYQNGEYTIYDWKRSDKIIANGIPIKTNKYGEKGNYPLEHIDNSPYYHYALQLSLYKFILERNYGIKVNSLRLGIFHPTYNKPYILEMPYLENEINAIFNLRSEVIF